MTYRRGKWMRLDPLENPINVIHPSGSMITGYLNDFPGGDTLSNYLPGVDTVNCLLGMNPPQLMELFIQKGQRVATGETDQSTRWFSNCCHWDHSACPDRSNPGISPGVCLSSLAFPQNNG
jgi:hypothetical protein